MTVRDLATFHKIKQSLENNQIVSLVRSVLGVQSHKANDLSLHLLFKC